MAYRIVFLENGVEADATYRLNRTGAIAFARGHCDRRAADGVTLSSVVWDLDTQAVIFTTTPEDSAIAVSGAFIVATAPTAT
jgi:hypothetical protein